jgi:xylulose-5-phosphate/fructose-6-phosphate phosphoketolase
MEVLAARAIIAELMPDVRVRTVNVVDLMRLQPHTEHPHGLSDDAYDAIFTNDRAVIFAFHGYPSLIHQLTYRRRGHDRLHVRGYKEEGTTTTPFDMTVLNDLDRFKLVMDVIDRVPGLHERYPNVREEMLRRRREHREYIIREGEDPPAIRDWKWKN